MKQAFCRLGYQNDLEFIGKLSDRVFSRYGNYDEILPAWVLDPRVMTIIITEDTERLGFAMLQIERRAKLKPRKGQLLAIAVKPDRQRQGIGKKLLAHVESLACERGVKEVYLCTAQDNKHAQSFFQKAGYELKGSEEHYYPKGQPALVMSKGLGL
jgi:ribosomal protein S18 acetylase RimI-like enzyme